jgi:hypothetical protein
MDAAAIAKAAAQAAEAAPMDTIPVVPMVPGRVLLFDGDYAAYFFAGSEDCSQGDARRNLLDYIAVLKILTGSERCEVHLTHDASHKGHRFVIATVKPYQGQRNHSSKPKNWQFMRDFMENYQGNQFSVHLWRDREADDGIAFRADQLGEMLAAIAMRDKDSHMIPGLHIDWMNKHLTQVSDKIFSVYDEQVSGEYKWFGHKWFWLQCLQGDGADNIPGLPKFKAPSGTLKDIGAKTAEKFLADVNDNYTAAVRVGVLYHSYYGEDWAMRLAEQMCLLWMRRDAMAKPLNMFNHFNLPHDGFRRVLTGAVAMTMRRVKEAYDQLPT